MADAQAATPIHITAEKYIRVIYSILIYTNRLKVEAVKEAEMAGAKTTLSSVQRVLITIDGNMKKEAAEMFAAQGVSFSEGVRQCITARMAGNADPAVLLDGETKQKAEKVLADMGLDIETAVNMFLKEVVRTGSIPFAVQTGKGSLTYTLVPLDQEAEPETQD